MKKIKLSDVFFFVGLLLVGFGGALFTYHIQNIYDKKNLECQKNNAVYFAKLDKCVRVVE
jgi:hypothetical protein